jgi:hypothetical protein
MRASDVRVLAAALLTAFLTAACGDTAAETGGAAPVASDPISDVAATTPPVRPTDPDVSTVAAPTTGASAPAVVSAAHSAEFIHRLHDLLGTWPLGAIERGYPTSIGELGGLSDVVEILTITELRAEKESYEDGHIVVHQLHFIGKVDQLIGGSKQPIEFRLTVGGPVLDSPEGAEVAALAPGSKVLVFLADEEDRSIRSNPPMPGVRPWEKPAAVVGLFTPTVTYAILPIGEGSLTAPLSDNDAFNKSLTGVDLTKAIDAINKTGVGTDPRLKAFGLA